MIAKAVSKYTKISPKKARLVVDVIRGKSVNDALAMLPNINKKAAELLQDTVKSAYHNAKIKFPNENYSEDILYISKITADEGPSLSRYRAASMGRASVIKKRTSHILVELDVNQKKLQFLKEQEAKTSQKGKQKPVKKAKTRTSGKKASVKGSK